MVHDIDVYSPDTDVFLLLMDLVAVHQVQGELNFVTGTGKGQRKIDVHERCSAITNLKSEVLQDFMLSLGLTGVENLLEFPRSVG